MIGKKNSRCLLKQSDACCNMAGHIFLLTRLFVSFYIKFALAYYGHFSWIWLDLEIVLIMILVAGNSVEIHVLVLFSQIYPRIGDIVVTVKETGRCFRVRIVSVPFGSGIGVDRVCVFLLIFLIWFPCSNEFTSPTPTTKSNILLLFKLYYLTYYTLNGLGNTCTAHSRVHVRYELSIHGRADTATNWVRMIVNCKRYYCVQRNKNNNISILRQNDSIFDIATDVFILQAQTKTRKVAIFRKVSVEPP